MNFLVKWIVEKEGVKMLTSLWSKIDGYKSYGLAVVAIFVALVGHFWGPISIGAIQIPAFDWSAFWALTWKACLVIAGRSTIDKLINP
jgi:hypothetical protein